MTRQAWEITADMFLSLSETHQLLEHLRARGPIPTGVPLRDGLDRTITETLLWSGIRNSEFCRLTLGDARLGTRSPHLHIREPRGESRDVFIPGDLSDLLAAYIRDLRPKLLALGSTPDDPDSPLIFHERRRPFERSGLYRRVVRILEDAGLGARASVQLLRHTYGYLAYLQTGGNLLFVQRQLGHAHPMVTAVYARFVQHDSSELANRIADQTTSRIADQITSRIAVTPPPDSLSLLGRGRGEGYSDDR